MIAKMAKVYIAASRADRERLLDALRNLGVVHLIPVDPDAAVADERTVHNLDTVGRAIQVLLAVEAEGTAPEIAPRQAAAEVLDIYRRSVERTGRLNSLHRQLEQIEIWGQTRLESLESLRQAGVDPKFYRVANDDVAAVRAEFVQPIAQLHDKRTLIAIIQRSDGEVELPESAEEIEPPTRDAPALKAEAAEIDEQLQADTKELKTLVNLLPALQAEHAKLEAAAEYTVAKRGGLKQEKIFAVQGWAPADGVESLPADLARLDMPAAVQTIEPDENEEPPTLVRYPRCVKPIKALFDILGTTPGYREYDLSPFFMVALPIFSAMLIGDGGYGLIFLIVGLLGYRKLSRSVARYAANMLLIFAVVSLGWGAISGNFFGVSPMEMISAGGFWAVLGGVLQPLAVLWREDPSAGRAIMIKICFIFATIHLVLAHLRAALGKAPDLRALAELGWCCFLVGMLGIVWAMFFKDSPLLPLRLIFTLLSVGAGLFVLFSYPSRNPAKMLSLGIVTNLLPMIGTFSDTISYIRLMAVGLASYYIASAFNGLAMDVASGGTILIAPAILILLFAHALNICLCLIAIFAHGVRLNMLEFSNNAGVQWAGYPYAPFAVRQPVSKGES